MDQRNEPCWCGSGKKWKKCHYPLSDRHSSSPKHLAALYWKQYRIRLKTEEEIIGIRRACKLAAQILQKTCAMAKAGVTTEELDLFAHKLYLEGGAIPATLGYGHPPYTKTICTSINEVICHGIPEKRALQEGDIINIDVTAKLNGYFGDCSAMVMIGEVGEEKQRVVQAAYESLMHSIEILKPSLPLNAIGDVIEEVAARYSCSVVYQFVGHGTGVSFHEEPKVHHNRNNIRIPLVPGMIFTIEPMINAGIPEGIVDPLDHWTVRTKDGRPSAQWEHTLLITETGYEILTLAESR